MVSRLKHDNFVQLLRDCVDGNSQILAYEFAKNGSLHEQTKEHSQLNSSSAMAELCDERIARESHCPSPSRPTITERDIISSVVSRLGDLEKQIETLDLRKSEMPHEKEELLNAAVYHVDALEAEIITTKKALHEALMRQEDLLAYIDRQEEAKYRSKKFCW